MEPVVILVKIELARVEVIGLPLGPWQEAQSEEYSDAALIAVVVVVAGACVVVVVAPVVVVVAPVVVVVAPDVVPAVVVVVSPLGVAVTSSRSSDS